MKKKKKQTHYQIVLTQNNIIKKNTMICHPKVKLQERVNELYIYIYIYEMRSSYTIFIPLIQNRSKSKNTL